jgi:NADH:ubiquinone oxidoreductase subunit F (NADH-binding)
MVMEGDPYLLIEGMVIAGLAVGATQGLVYVRSEYPHAIAALREAIARAAEGGWLGPDVAGSGYAFSLDVRVAAGSYVCGEETALLESLARTPGSSSAAAAAAAKRQIPSRSASRPAGHATRALVWGARGRDQPPRPAISK